MYYIQGHGLDTSMDDNLGKGYVANGVGPLDCRAAVGQPMPSPPPFAKLSAVGCIAMNQPHAHQDETQLTCNTVLPLLRINRLCSAYVLCICSSEVLHGRRWHASSERSQ
jgi:hypothetical protein